MRKCGVQGPQASAGVWGSAPSPVPQHKSSERCERPKGRKKRGDAGGERTGGRRADAGTVAGTVAERRVRREA